MNAFEYFNPFIRDMLTVIPLLGVIIIGIGIGFYGLKRGIRR